MQCERMPIRRVGTLRPGRRRRRAVQVRNPRRPDALLPQKADPVGFGAELRPQTASVVRDTSRFVWTDGEWMPRRALQDPRRVPISIYEVHLASWRRDTDGSPLSYDELADALIPYAIDLGFTHLELMPVSEYPHDPSWGYQPIGFSRRHHASASRQGSRALSTAAMPPGWASCSIGCPRIFRWTRTGSRCSTARRCTSMPIRGRDCTRTGRPRFSISAGPRSSTISSPTRCSGSIAITSTAFASMRWRRCCHLDYSRKEGEWVPNRYGGNENLEAVAFLRKLNEDVYARHPGVITIAEESTTWPGVSHPDLHRRTGLRIQVEHGVDARHARVPA